MLLQCFHGCVVLLEFSKGMFQDAVQCGLVNRAQFCLTLPHMGLADGHFAATLLQVSDDGACVALDFRAPAVVTLERAHCQPRCPVRLFSSHRKCPSWSVASGKLCPLLCKDLEPSPLSPRQRPLMRYGQTLSCRISPASSVNSTACGQRSFLVRPCLTSRH